MPADPELSNAVTGFLSQMWQHVDQTVRVLLSNHRRQHEPGGTDMLRLPLSFLADVDAKEPDIGDTIIYTRYKDDNNNYRMEGVGWWKHGPAGGQHQAHVGLILPTDVVPPGPTNICDAAFDILAVRVAHDGTSVTGTFSAGTFGCDLENGYYDSNDPEDDVIGIWGVGSTMTVSLVTYSEDVTWLTVDIAIE